MTATVTIDPGSTVPPYEQLRAQLAFQVKSGTLAAGERLPTVRQLASDLGLAKNTVNRAFRELEEAGLVLGAGRRGTIVLPRPEAAADRQQLIAEATRRFHNEISTLEPTLEELINAVQAVSRRGGVAP